MISNIKHIFQVVFMSLTKGAPQSLQMLNILFLSSTIKYTSNLFSWQSAHSCLTCVFNSVTNDIPLMFMIIILLPDSKLIIASKQRIAWSLLLLLQDNISILRGAYLFQKHIPCQPVRLKIINNASGWTASKYVPNKKCHIMTAWLPYFGHLSKRTNYVPSHR